MALVRSLSQDFFKTWSSEMAYVLGFFAADGSMLANKRGGYFIEFNITDRIILEHIQRASGSNHKIAERTPDARNKKHWKQLYRLQIGSKEWFTDLEALGFRQHKSNTLEFPSIPQKYVGHFVRGYFDGDGCVYFSELKYADRTYKRWILLTLFTSGSRSFLQSLHTALRRNGVQGGSLCKKSASGFELKFSHHDSLALYRLMYHTAEASEMFLPRKREKLERAIRELGLDT
ncbi:MAG: LAGLIDADG family homing endonuclease [Patescibacteria group bacterium]